jgi:CRISPR/Cas system-associated exonuclease Cas4 (RecB family)
MTTGKLTKILNSIAIENETPRDYIGASSIGSPCMRQIWYAYNGYVGEPISPRLARTFEIGKRLEGMVLDDLESAGLYVIRDWWDLVDRELPYFKGHVDAVIGDAIIEVKTAKDSSFKQFVKHGLRKWSPQYYAQLQAYMGMSGICESYLICLNKDTSELHDEQVMFQPQYYDGLRLKAEMIHAAQEPPPRVNHSPVFYVCKTCRYRRVCHDRD